VVVYLVVPALGARTGEMRGATGQNDQERSVWHLVFEDLVFNPTGLGATLLTRGGFAPIVYSREDRSLFASLPLARRVQLEYVRAIDIDAPAEANNTRMTSSFFAKPNR
jgi:hypothetical protein